MRGGLTSGGVSRPSPLTTEETDILGGSVKKTKRKLDSDEPGLTVRNLDFPPIEGGDQPSKPWGKKRFTKILTVYCNLLPIYMGEDE